MKCTKIYMVCVSVDASTGDHKDKWLNGQYEARRTCLGVQSKGYKDGCRKCSQNI
jgi:hypothetical protein